MTVKSNTVFAEERKFFAPMNRKKNIGILCSVVGLFLALCVRGQEVEKVFFSAPGGFYEESFSLELSTMFPEHLIYYTLNGNIPTPDDFRYDQALTLDAHLYSTSDIYQLQISPEAYRFVPDTISKTIVIRAAAFDNQGNRLSEVGTQSYFIKELGCDTHGLPVVSLCCDSLSLFDYDTGIMVMGSHYDPSNPDYSGNYYQKGREWERLSNVEFYELDNSGVNQQVGLRTHGNISRRYPQKGLKIYAREEYGKKRFKHRFFETISHNSFKHLVLKPYRCSWDSTGIGDYLALRIAQPLNMEAPASRPAVLFLNGEYWGIYFVQEKTDERFLEDHLDINFEQVNLMTDYAGHTDAGTAENYLEFYRWMETADLSLDANYRYAATRMDMDNFIDYQIFEIYVMNIDWPANNVKIWQEGDGPFRWIYYDGDACFGEQYIDMFWFATYTGDWYYPTNDQSTLIFRKLLENDEFRTHFRQRFQALVTEFFSYAHTQPYLEEITQKLREEIPNMAARFGFPSNEERWSQERLPIVDHFLRVRPRQVLEELYTFFGIEEPSVREIFVTPNPFVHEASIHLTTEQDGPCEVFIYNVLGQGVYHSTQYLSEGENVVSISLLLSSGIYFLKAGEVTTKIQILYQ